MSLSNCNQPFEIYINAFDLFTNNMLMHMDKCPILLIVSWALPSLLWFLWHEEYIKSHLITRRRVCVCKTPLKLGVCVCVCVWMLAPSFSEDSTTWSSKCTYVELIIPPSIFSLRKYQFINMFSLVMMNMIA